jgi:hypothetical protein
VILSKKRSVIEELIIGTTSYLRNRSLKKEKIDNLSSTLNDLVIVLKQRLEHEQRNSDLLSEEEIAKDFLKYLKSIGYGFFYKVSSIISKQRPSIEQVRPYIHGKYFTKKGQNLYIYVKDRKNMFNFDIFPDELNLFDSESTWQISGRMAILQGAQKESILKAESILQNIGFLEWDHPEETLLNYYTLGDCSMLE